METSSYNGSVFYHAWNDGTISNQTWLNASSGNAQLATTEGQGIEEAVQRMGYYKFRYGLAVINGMNITSLTVDDFQGFNTYTFSDNASYWRMESNRSIVLGGKTHTLRFKHSQQATDDLISLTIELNTTGAYNAPQDVWLAVALANLTEFNLVDYVGTDGRVHSASPNDSLAIYNWTQVKVVRWPDGWGWRFDAILSQLPLQEDALILESGVVWMAFKLGGTLSGGKQVNLQAIDETNCIISCQFGDSAAVNYGIMGDTAGQDAENLSYSFNWTDLNDTCGLNSGCAIHCTANDPYAAIGAQKRITTIGTAGSPLWVTCDLSNTTNACTDGSPVGLKKTNPVKNTDYIYAVTEQGRYSKTGFFHTSKCDFVGLGLTTATSLQGADTISPSIKACYLVGAAFTNNTVVNLPTSNGSLAWANASFSCDFDDEAKPYGGTGLVNVSGLKLNRTGFTWNITDLTDRPWGTQNITWWDFQLGGYYQACAAVNGTNRQASDGRDTNWSEPIICYIFGVNIVPTGPVPSVNLSSPSNGSLELSSNFLNFSCNASSNYFLDEVELWGNWGGGWHANQSYDFDNNLTVTHTFNAFVEDGYFEWNCKYFDVYGLSAFAQENWTFGIENQSRNAIADGVKNVTPNASISTSQQIYIVNENEQHYLGRFDKTSTLDNQTWAFNYVTTPLESFVGMPSLKNVAIVWENQTLSLQQIFDQVVAFISSTMQ
ncbi:MAG: hypothetical protein V1787_03535 [Candidatus Micrarchaeota archaeon]